MFLGSCRYCVQTRAHWVRCIYMIIRTEHAVPPAGGAGCFIPAILHAVGLNRSFGLKPLPPKWRVMNVLLRTPYTTASLWHRCWNTEHMEKLQSLVILFFLFSYFAQQLRHRCVSEWLSDEWVDKKQCKSAKQVKKMLWLCRPLCLCSQSHGWKHQRAIYSLHAAFMMTIWANVVNISYAASFVYTTASRQVFILAWCFSLLHRKNVDDFTGPRERSDLGFLTFDLSADIL